MSIHRQIISYCTRNRVSTTEASDAIGKTGVPFMVAPVNEGLYKVGRIKCVFTANNSNWDVHDQIRSASEGDIIIVFTYKCDENRAILGDLLSKYALLYRGAAAIIVQGAIRDVASVKRQRYAVWSQSVSPLGCHNHQTKPFPELERKRLLEMYDGGIAICDDGGVTLIENSLLNSTTLDRLKMIEMQEDIWFYCLDVLKWDTKRIVCSKDYLNADAENEFPRAMISIINQLDHSRHVD